MLEHLPIYIYIFHLDVHYVCMLVRRFEPQGRRFTNFHYYYITLIDFDLLSWLCIEQCQLELLS